MSDGEVVALVIQAGATVAAAGAAIVALVVSHKERKNARRLAEEDRRATKLQHDLSLLIRLLENRNRGGSSDREESSRLGAEALTLVGYLGPEMLPRQWKRQVTPEESSRSLETFLDDPDLPDYKKDAIETQLAVQGIVDELKELAKPLPPIKV